jgi:hypothetical protein
MLDLCVMAAMMLASIKWNAGVLNLPLVLLILTAGLGVWLGMSPIMHILFAAIFAAGYTLQPRRNTLILAPYLVMVAYQTLYAIYDYSTTYAGFLYHAHSYVVTFIYSLFIFTSYRCRFVRDSIDNDDSRRSSLTARYNPINAHETRSEKEF